MSMFRRLRGTGPEPLSVNDRDRDQPREGRPGLPIQSNPGSDQKGVPTHSTKATQEDVNISVTADTSVADSSFYHLTPPRHASHDSDSGDPLGLTLIHGNPSDSSVDLIFVHGLGGSSMRTWSWERDVDLFWPEWIRHEEGLSDCRVFSYGYNSNFWVSGGPVSILDFSKGLLVGMRDYGRGKAYAIGHRPIIFIAHSMGGLVVKKALIIGKNDNHFSPVLSMVQGIMFFSTPHRGSSHARTLNNFLTMLGSRTKIYVSELDTSSTSIEDINEQFRTICGQLRLVSLYETLATRLFAGVKKMIVPEESGVLKYPNELPCPINADHHTICKFHSRLDPNYLHAIGLLRHLACQSAQAYGETRTYQVHALREILGVQGAPEDDFDRNLSRALPGSCEWLYESENFKRWMDGTDTPHRVLWLTGMPGLGKSTLAAKTIAHIQKTLPCQYHFFIVSQPEKSNAAYCIRALAFQLATTHPPLAESLLRLHKETKFSATSQSFQLIWETVFENIIFKMEFGRTLHWVFDALDEAESPTPFIHKLTKVMSRSPIRVLIFSRASTDLMGLGKKYGESVVIEPISMQQTLTDIRRYIDSMSTAIFPEDGVLQKAVAERIATKAEGSFLWTRLALESLQGNSHTLQDVDQVLEAPNGMQQVYERMLDTVKALPSRVRPIAFRILTLVACSYRPLTTSELAAALMTEFGAFANLGETVLQICGQFVRIEQETLLLVHGTAGQFLLQASLETPINHDQMAIFCLRYLTGNVWRQALARAPKARPLRTGSNSLEALYEKVPFLAYAMSFWAYHVSLSTIDMLKVFSLLKRFLNEHVLLWVHAVALSGNLRTIPTAATYIRKWLGRRRKQRLDENPINPGAGIRLSVDIEFLEKWAEDLTHLVARFGANLAQDPSAIYRHAPPFCPQASVLRATYYGKDDPLITLKGLSNDDWEDNLARRSVGKEHETASKIRCAGSYVFTLISSGGTVIVWHAETFEEIRRICHEEWVRLMETNTSGSMVATDGRSAIRVWDTSTGGLLHSLPKDNGVSLKSLDFFHSGIGLVVCYDDCSMVSYDLKFSTETTMFAPQDQEELWNCPRFMTPSPDHTRLAIGFPGRAVQVLEVSLSPQPEPRSIVCSGDRARLETGEEVFNPADLVRWHPDGSMLFILYHDTAILSWDLVSDAQSEFRDTEAREMAVNHRGTLLSTSNSCGSISVWGLPKFNLVYRVQSEQFVRHLTFSPDSRRIYDVRGSNFNVWAPDALLYLEAVEHEKSDSWSGDEPPRYEPKPVLAEDKSLQTQVTALECDYEDEFYCCGKDDGSVSIHEMSNGTRVRKVSSHSAGAEIVAIGWSSSRRFIASADDSGKIVVKRLRIKDDDKWAVYPLFELRVMEESVPSLLFSLDETMLLISTSTSVRVWDVRKKAELCKAEGIFHHGSKWTNRPDNNSQLICVEPDQLRIHEWASLTPIVGDEPDPRGPQVDKTSTEEELPEARTGRLAESGGAVGKVVMPKSNKFVLYEVSYDRNPRLRSHTRKLFIAQIAGLTQEAPTGVRRKELMGLGPEVRHILGCSHDRLFFLDHDNWVCTSAIGWDMGAKRRLYFIPGDWVNGSVFPLILANADGTLLCAKYGEVAIVRYNGRL